MKSDHSKSPIATNAPPGARREFARRDFGNIHKLLRRQTIEPIVRVSKWVMIAVSAGLLILTIAQIIRGSISASGEKATLRQKIEEVKGKVEGSGRIKTEKVNLKIISSRNVFGPLSGPAPTPAAQNTKGEKIPLVLIGTYITDGEAPYAILEDKNKSQEIFGVGELVFDVAKLLAIYPDKVQVDRSGSIEWLNLDDSIGRSGGDFKGGIAALDGDQFIVEEAELDKALENLPMLLTQARAVPYFRDGRATGLRLFAIKAGSLYEKLGLKNGDILKSINENSLADLSQAMQLFEKLKSERNMTVTLERNAEDKQFKYEIR